MSHRTLHTWRWVTRMLFQHLPSRPYPSDHPSALRRAPREFRG